MGKVSADGGTESAIISWKTAKASNSVMEKETFSPASDGIRNDKMDISVNNIDGNSMLST